jgi:hypothetical protein
LYFPVILSIHLIALFTQILVVTASASRKGFALVDIAMRELGIEQQGKGEDVGILTSPQSMGLLYMALV